MDEIRTSIQRRWHRNITDVLMNHRNITADAILVLSALFPERAPPFAPALGF